MLTERKDIDPLPDWKLLRIDGQIVPLTKNNAMRLMLECWAKPEGAAIFPKNSGRKNPQENLTGKDNGSLGHSARKRVILVAHNCPR